MKIAPITLALAVLATPVFAELPRYDIPAFCQDKAETGGDYDESEFRTCSSIEELAERQLKPIWDSVPAALQQDCDRTATFFGIGSYSLLQTCLQMKGD